ncbi:reverse transcriptase domain-containing protein, partial [Tanacetum coccineum]
MFLGHVVNMKGIKACPDKAEAVIKLQSPRTLKEVQSLNGKLASLNRAANGNRTQTWGRTDTLPLRSQRSNQCGPANEKRLTADASLLFLADFIAERPDEDGPPVGIQVEEAILDPWTLFTDGSSCLEGSGSGLILTNPEGVEFIYALRFEFEASNNEAGYEALVAGLRIAKQMGVQNFEARVDSRFVASQINGSYVEKEQRMIQYLEKSKMLISGFKKFSIKQVLRSENKKADALSKFTSTSFSHLAKQVLVEVLKEKSIGEREVLAVIEAKAVATITGTQIKKFVWDNIVCRFGFPGEIISDNGKQFIDNPFKAWCEKLNIKQRFPSVKRPQTNGHVKRANRSLGEGIKARHTPFSLTYGTEAVISVKIGMPSLRCEKIDQTMNDEALLLNLDILEEEREKAAIQEVKSKAKMERYYNAKVCGTTFKPGDFVYRSNEASHAKDNEKLDPKWKGPYEVVEALGKGAYKIRNSSGDILT